MKPTKACGLVFVLLVALLLYTSSVLALGVSPAKKHIPYEVGQTYEGVFRVVNDQPHPIDVHVEVPGPYQDIITLGNTKYTLNSEFTAVPYTIDMSRPLPPGETEIPLYVEELGSAIELSTQGISARIQIPHKLYLTVPYPDKYVIAEVRIKDTPEVVKFSSLLKNVGEDINTVKAFHDVQENGQKITTVVSEPKSLAAHNELRLDANIGRQELTNGAYTSVSTINFDDKHVTIEKDFKVGEPRFDLENYDRYASNGQVTRMNFQVFNDWNEPIERVVVTADISQNGRQVSTVTSATFQMDGRGRQSIPLFWDSRNLALGRYQGEITIEGAGKSTVHTVDLEVLREDDYSTKSKGNDIIVVQEGLGVVEIMMVGIMLAMIIVLIVILLYISRLMKKK